MNWRRGLLRAWIVVSAFWLCGIGTYIGIEWPSRLYEGISKSSWRYRSLSVGDELDGCRPEILY